MTLETIRGCSHSNQERVPDDSGVNVFKSLLTRGRCKGVGVQSDHGYM